MRRFKPHLFSRSIVRTALAIVLSAPASGALAAGVLDSERRPGLDRGGERHADRCNRCRASRCTCHLNRGWITIGRSRVDFRYGDSVASSLARSLRHDGFDAYIHDGCIVVQGRYNRVRINARGYQFKVWCDGHKTIIQPKRFHRGGHFRSHWRGHDRRGYHRDFRRDNRRWHDRRHDRRFDRWRHRRGC